MKKGDVVTEKAISGEYVGKLTKQDGAVVTLENPRVVITNPDNGNMGFAKGIATGIDSPKSAVFNSVVMVVNTNPLVEEASLKATGEKLIDTPNQKLLRKEVEGAKKLTIDIMKAMPFKN